MKALCFLSAVGCGLLTVTVMAFMVILGFPLFQDAHSIGALMGVWNPSAGLYGIGPMIVSSLAISLPAVLIGFPISLGTAAAISTIAPGPIARLLGAVVRMMTGIPTVVYGFVGIFLLVPLIRTWFSTSSGMCILTASLLLSLLVSPTMILFFTESFAQVPKPSMLAATALGARRIQVFLYVVLPESIPGLLSGLLLGVGRAMGDTMISLMVAGNSVAFPSSLLDSARTLTAHIGLVIASDVESLAFKSIFASGVMLYLTTTLLVVLLRLIPRVLGRKS